MPEFVKQPHSQIATRRERQPDPRDARKGLQYPAVAKAHAGAEVTTPQVPVKRPAVQSDQVIDVWCDHIREDRAPSQAEHLGRCFGFPRLVEGQPQKPGAGGRHPALHSCQRLATLCVTFPKHVMRAAAGRRS